MDLNVLNWNWDEKAAAGRNVLSYVAGGVTMLVGWHFIAPDQGSAITDNLTTIWDGVVKIGTGVAGLAAALTPIYTALVAKHSASPSSQVKSVVANLGAPHSEQAANALADPLSRNALINAVSEMPEVRAIVAPKAVVDATPSPKVVNTPEAVTPLPLAIPPKVDGITPKVAA
jgi:hypothetical protein